MKKVSSKTIAVTVTFLVKDEKAKNNLMQQLEKLEEVIIEPNEGILFGEDCEYLAEWPDTDGSIRVRDTHGNCVAKLEPEAEIETFRFDEIQEPFFLDVKNPCLFWNGKEK